RAHRGVERREELVGHVGLAAGQRAHPARLARVGVPDQRDGRDLGAARAPHARLPGDRLQLFPQLRDAIADAPAIELEPALSGALPADAAALPIRASAALAQARHLVDQARDLHLQLRLAGPSVPLEDRQDHARAIEDRRAGRALEVARLRRAEIVIDQHHRGPLRRLAVFRLRAVARLLGLVDLALLLRRAAGHHACTTRA